MKTDETIRLLSDKAFLDKLFGYAYKRCATAHEAEDLCSDILMNVLKGIRQGRPVDNFYAYVWTIARRTYADYCEKRKLQSDTLSNVEYMEQISGMQINPIEEFAEKEEDALKLKQVMREIAFLSKTYRDVMVMYYLDERKVSEIAAQLDISETTVKQRLFSARNTIRKEVEKVDSKNLSLKPVFMWFSGTGNPIGNNPAEYANRLLSQNLVYLCKKEAKSAKELSEALGVPMIYIEQELAIQCNGVNGNYGLLRKLENGKYISNILIADKKEEKEANALYRKHLEEYCGSLKKVTARNRDKMLDFPFLSPQKDPQFILWSLIAAAGVVWDLQKQVERILSEKYFKDVEPIKREYTVVALADSFEEASDRSMTLWGCDGIGANNLCGYSRINVTNIYGKYIDRHFCCGHNISMDSQLLLTVRAIGGLLVETLSDEEKEVAAKAIECGYLRKCGNILEPNILVLEEENRSAFYNLLADMNEETKSIADKIAEEVAVFIKKQVPKHLLGEYQTYSTLIAGSSILPDVIEECVKEGLLKVPANRICGEGTVMLVKK